MDTLTHIVAGACIGEVIAGKQLGRKALFLGAIAQSIPDIDFIASFWLPVSQDLLAHRGFTHSFLFMALVTPLLALLSGKLFKNSNVSLKRWLLFWGLQIFIHLLLDAFNTYGVGWFVPFSRYRIAFNTMFVADPLFSIWPAIAFIMLLALKPGNKKRRIIAGVSLGISVLYLVLGVAFKGYIDRAVQRDLSVKHIGYSRFFSTPTPLNNLLWYIVAQNDSGYFIAYRSVLDHKKDIDWHYVYRNDSLLQLSANTRDISRLKLFSRGYYAVEMRHDTLVFNDLWFGEILGWAESSPQFVCHYYLQYPDNNEMIVQRGRFAKWNKETIGVFLRRIKGI